MPVNIVGVIGFWVKVVGVLGKEVDLISIAESPLVIVRTTGFSLKYALGR